MKGWFQAGLFVLLTTQGGRLWCGEAEEWFEREVHPLLATRCLECHGDDEPDGGLRLTSRDLVLRGGESGPAAVAGQPAASRLLQAVKHSGRLKMPPDARLSDAEVAVLERWIERGLPWSTGGRVARPAERTVTDADREHWSFRPLSRPPLPDVRNVAWPGSAVDHFILARLEAADLAPAPLVDRRTLFRRLTYDLTGLPPTWEDLEDFLHDPAPTEAALGRVVDRLLASPRYGERWGRHWLDVARFADTKDGVLMYGDDRIRPYAYTYRDYVIRAFNEDLPFDQFVSDQLAADRQEPAVAPWRLAALGFLTLGRMYDNNVHDIIDDQIDVVGRGLLGLTVACARCHDHKYDPVPMADYYSLYGVFASSEAPLEPPLIANPQEIPGGVEFEKQAGQKRADLQAFVDQQFTLLSDTARRRIPDYLERVATTPADPLETAIFFLSLAPEDLRPPITARWRRLIERRALPDDPVFGLWHQLYALPADDPARFAAAAAEVLTAAAKQPPGTERGHVNPLILAALQRAPLMSRGAMARAYGAALLEAADSLPIAPTNAGASNTGAPHAGQASAGPASGDLAAAKQQLVELVIGPGSPSYFPKSQTRRYMSRQETDSYGGKVKEIDLLAVRSPHAPPRAMVLQDAAQPVEPRIFTRGNPSQPGRTVPRHFLAIATAEPRADFGPGSGRLALAHAIVSRDNPLTARVIANRIWHWHFGEPLAASPSDFGLRSASPPHRELLDWLAAELQDAGWSLKHLHRQLVLSRLFQQSTMAADAARARQIDPDNQLWSRLPRQRLDLESMRDTLLAVSGRLEHRLAGRPVEIAADAQARVRTVYGLVDRQSLPGVFRAFDFAAPDQSVERRPRTMVPQQALFALNSSFMITQAQSLAAQLESAGITATEARIEYLYRRALARPPAAEEQAECTTFVATPLAPGSRLTRWEQLAQILLSSNELMYLD
ncbi:MAG: PSD1 and planctomycete cytochrome C domain-containing protein [Pirellulales bacterium]